MRKLSYNPLWKKLIDLRWTKTELAEKAGISRSSIKKMRRDDPVALDLIVKIANTLDLESEGLSGAGVSLQIKGKNLSGNTKPNVLASVLMQ